MSLRRGFYRHYNGHLYYVYGVGCARHENNRRMVVYTSVKTEEGTEGFDFLLRDEKEFEEFVYEMDGMRVEPGPRLTSTDLKVRRFERVTHPEGSIVARVRD